MIYFAIWLFCGFIGSYLALLDHLKSKSTSHLDVGDIGLALLLTLLGPILLIGMFSNVVIYRKKK